MIPLSIAKYLESHHAPYRTRFHTRAISAPELAASTHVKGDRVAKSVIVEADGKKWIAVLPATELLDMSRLASALGASEAHLLDEHEFSHDFPECDVGAEPPFGGLFHMPVIADDTLAEQPEIVMRGGSHEEVVEMRWEDFEELEHPKVAAIGQRGEWIASQRSREERV